MEKGKLMRKFVVAVALVLSTSAHAENWVLLSSDDSSRTLLDAASVQRKSSDEVRFQIQRVHSAQKDMMGLQYNITRSRYLLNCQSGLVLFRQQFLLQDDEVVWTFPESDKAQKASMELPDGVMADICRRSTQSPR
jgi:hypothetical protein